MADMWRNRAPPTPLDFDGIADGSFILTPNSGTSSNDVVASHGTAIATSLAKATPNGTSKAANASTGLKDQKELTLQESLVLFVSR